MNDLLLSDRLTDREQFAFNSVFKESHTLLLPQKGGVLLLNKVFVRAFCRNTG